MRLVLILIASATLGVGCAFPRGRSEPATFFTLTPLETLDGAAGEPTKEVLGLGPVAIPGYLDRPQLVTRVGANEVQLAAVARWGEPIREGIVRVLRQNLMAASAARAVIVYPWTSAAPVDLAAAVGPRDAMPRLVGATAEIVDVRGATVMPGLVDTHPHVLHFGAFAEPLVDIADARSHDDIVARIRARAATTPPGEWIMTTPV